MAGARFIHVGGAGRGADWAGIVEADADTERLGDDLVIGQSVLIQREQPTRSFGPYYSRTALLIRPSRDVVVLFGVTSGEAICELPPQADMVAVARQTAALVNVVSPAKRLADQLKILHAVRELAHTRRDDASVEDVLSDVARIAADALGCELAIAWMPHERLHIYESGWTVPDRGTTLSNLLREMWAAPDTLPRRKEDAEHAPLAYPLSPGAGVVSSYSIAIGSPPTALLVVAHTTTDPRGYTQFCRDLMAQLATIADTLHSTALSRQHHLQTVAKASRADRELAKDNDELEVGAMHHPLTGLPNRVLLQQQPSDSTNSGRPRTRSAPQAPRLRPRCSTSTWTSPSTRLCCAARWT